jgi:hypothetical protein
MTTPIHEQPLPGGQGGDGKDEKWESSLANTRLNRWLPDSNDRSGYYVTLRDQT